jgi:hypothetical protein
VTKPVFFLLPLLLIAPFCWSHPVPLDEAEVANLFTSGNFGALEVLKSHALRTRDQNTSGDWQLECFYSIVFYEAERMAAASEKKFRDHMGAWAKEYPKSVTWRIVLGDALIDVGWDKRGTSFAKDVTPDGWTGFESYLTEAWNVLQEARNISRGDPQLYATITAIAMGLGRDPSQGRSVPFGSLINQFTANMAGVPRQGAGEKLLFEEIFQEAIQQEKYFPQLYRAQSINYLERWYGNPGDTERFAARAADLTSDRVGNSMYTVVAVTILNMLADEAYVCETTFDWQRLKSGWERMLQDFPDSNVWKNQFCRMACIYKDRETAAKMLKAIERPMPVLVWRSKGYFDHWSAWINGKAEYPVLNQMALAVKGSSLDKIEDLARSGESVNIYMLGGNTPLVLAVGLGNLKMTELLLRLGAETEVDSLKGNTPLTEAARSKDTAILEAILKNGANPDRPNREGWRALHQASKDGNIPVARVLLAAKADVNKRGAQEWTPLHVAAETNHPEMVKFLLENGADKSLKLKDGRTPLDIAEKHGFSDIAALLR